MNETLGFAEPGAVLTPYNIAICLFFVIRLLLNVIIVTALVCDKRKICHTFKRFIIFRILINEICVIFVTLFMLPIPLLSESEFNGTGIMTYFKIDDYIQYNILALIIMFAGFIIEKTFLSKFAEAVYRYEIQEFYHILKRAACIYCGLVVLYTIITFGFYLVSLLMIKGKECRLFKNFPNDPLESDCPTNLTVFVIEIGPRILAGLFIVMTVLLMFIMIGSTMFVHKDTGIRAVDSPDSIFNRKQMMMYSYVEIIVDIITISIPVLGFSISVICGLRGGYLEFILTGFVVIIHLHGIAYSSVTIYFYTPVRKQCVRLFTRNNRVKLPPPHWVNPALSKF